LIADRNVIRYEPDYVVRALGEGSWNYEVVGIDLDYLSEDFGEGVRIAVLDTGADFDLLDVNSGYDFVNGDADAFDDSGHGTLTTSLLKNPLGGSEIYAVKVLDSAGGGYVSYVLEGINWAVTNNIDVVLMSFGCEGDSVFLQEWVDYAYSEGVLLIAAFGNDGDTRLIYPASYDSVVGVGSVNENLDRSSFSNYGETLELVAPGENILIGDDLVHGTSFSVPHVGVVASGIWASDLDLSNEDVRGLLRESALDLGDEGFDEEFGWGLVRLREEFNGLHKVDPPVHQWIAYQAASIWNTSEIMNYIPNTWSSSISYLDDYKITYGARMEDDEVNENLFGGCPYNKPYCDHFWDPDEGYDAGLNWNGQWDSAIRRAQNLWDENVIPNYVNGNKEESYYWLGRVAHILTDMGVPAHVHRDIHAPFYIMENIFLQAN